MLISKRLIAAVCLAFVRYVLFFFWSFQFFEVTSASFEHILLIWLFSSDLFVTAFLIERMLSGKIKRLYDAAVIIKIFQTLTGLVFVASVIISWDSLVLSRSIVINYVLAPVIFSILDLILCGILLSLIQKERREANITDVPDMPELDITVLEENE